MPPSPRSLVLGIDGGGTHTVALLAEAATGTILGRGTGGPSNIQAVGVEAALKELDAAIGAAFADAKIGRTKVAAACLGLAGVDLTEGLDIIRGWSDSISLTDRISVAN